MIADVQQNNMKFAISILIAAVLPVSAADEFIAPEKIIEKEGCLSISDGSSIYTFQKNGTFSLRPYTISGRTIQGIWKKGDDTDGSFIVEGRWAWINGASLNNDERIMKLWIYPLSGEKEIVAYDRQSVYKCYFLIDELIKK